MVQKGESSGEQRRKKKMKYGVLKKIRGAEGICSRKPQIMF
jgi:hypothetical protein